MKRSLGTAVALLSVAAAWCGEPVPDFTLRDENPNSVRYRQPVSPRDYVLQVSGYYFGAAS